MAFKRTIALIEKEIYLTEYRMKQFPISYDDGFKFQFRIDEYKKVIELLNK